MATKRHSNDDEIPPGKAGGNVAQSIVEFLSATSSGLIFWSRHPFEVAAEVQLRVRSSILPENAREPSICDWVTKRGFVVLCKPCRRSSGAVGFQVSVLFVSAVATTQPRVAAPPAFDLDPDWIRRLSGLN